MEFLKMESWSPYLVGAGIGILSWFTFLLSDRPIGCSTAFARSSGMIEKLFRGKKTLARPYYGKFAPEIDWEWMLVIGVVIGAFLSSIFSGSFRFEWIPELWKSNMGAAAVPRVTAAFAGGVFMGLGSRWAGGCTSGHGISGTLQLTLSSWIAAAAFFLSGIAAAHLLYRIF